MRTSSRYIPFWMAAALGFCQLAALAQLLPTDAGTTVNGFQDNFTNVTRDPGWQVINGGNENVFIQTNGVLRVSAPTNTENPNHLIYNPSGVSYDPAVQEVLARIRITQYTFTDGGNEDQLAGLALCCQSNAATTPAGGYCMMLAHLDGSDVFDSFIGRIQGNQVRMLDDYVAWGPGEAFAWQVNTWYWMRMSSDGSTISAKIWPADGTVAEPSDYQITWGEAATSARAGFAGITGPHVGPLQFEVDYFLLKSAGLPSITVSPVFDTFYLTAQPQNSTNAVGTTATFTTAAVGSGLSYQWQKAPAGSKTFSNISGATSASYTTPTLASGDNGSQYTCLVTSGGQSDNSQIATVTIDSTPPTVVWVKSLGSSTHVTLQFSKPVQLPANATGFAAPGLTFSGVSYGADNTQLIVASSAQTLGSNYNISISGVSDLPGNAISATSMALDMTLQMPVEFGTTVNGHQDDFDGASMDPNWVAAPTDPAVMAQFSQANGYLHFSTDTNVAGYDPEHLLYAPSSGYDNSNQEVLVRVRINSASKPDSGIRVGAAALGDPANANPGSAMNAAFFNYPSIGIYVRTVVDGQLVGTVFTNGNRIFDQFGAWYWMRVKVTQGDNVSTKVWHADGITPEPTAFQRNDTVTASADTPLYAGILAASGGAKIDFDVDYFLVKAAGLPSLALTAPDAFGFGPYLTFTAEPTNAVALPNTPVVLSVAANGSSTPTVQWQAAPDGSSAFTNITGATANNLTVSLSAEESGTQYRAVVSVPGLTETTPSATIITAPPLLLTAQNLGSANSVTLTFNRAVQVPASASGLSVNNGVTVSGVGAGALSSQIVLNTSALSLGQSYIVSASGVQDTYGSTMAPTNLAVNLNLSLPSDVGRVVNGFQDEFHASTRDPNWVPVGLAGDIYTQTGDGLLHVATPDTGLTSNPNRLLYEAQGYDPIKQEVLMRLRVNSFNAVGYDGGDAIAGATVANNPLTDYGTDVNGTAGGIDLLLCNLNDSAGSFLTPDVGFQAAFLNDWVAWGADAPYAWTTNEWYWLRLEQTTTNATEANVFGKIWLADGSTPEPASWMAVWTNTSVRTGFAGIDAASYFLNDGTLECGFDVDYFLLKAAGLPSITVTAPSAFTLLTPASPLTFTSITSSGTNVVLQWTGSGTLQWASVAIGPWTDLYDKAGAFSPYTISSQGASAAFYRLRQ